MARKVSPDMAYKWSGVGVATGALAWPILASHLSHSQWVSVREAAFPPLTAVMRGREEGSSGLLASSAGRGRNPYLPRTLASQIVLCSLICCSLARYKVQAGRGRSSLPSSLAL